ncbi:MAG: hypothetical protein SGPRY_010237 [Prymnesium sp.]
MGELAHRLGQLAARSLQSESSHILKTAGANKRGLSLRLDATLRQSHDMRVFGLGTLASLSSRQRYARFTNSMHAVYNAMETRLDSSPSPPLQVVWARFGHSLRREPSLRADLAEVGCEPQPAGHTEATSRYVQAIHDAADSDGEVGGARLLGHVYTRYFADLFGGQALALPTRLALDLSARSPRHYDFGEFGSKRRESIEAVYAAINAATEGLPEEALEEIVQETRRAFAHNVEVYSEEGRLYSDSAHGAFKMASGYVRHTMSRR